MAKYAAWTGQVIRTAFTKHKWRQPAEYIVEMENERGEVFTFVAYGITASTLSGYMGVKDWYTVEYEPWSSGEFAGELAGAQGFDR